MAVIFRKANKSKKKLKLAIEGPSGTGKTWSALLLARSMGCINICLLDTEKGSSDLYSKHFDFEKTDLLPPYSPERYIEVIEAAQQNGYDCLIIDSASHEHIGKGGLLNMVNRTPGNSFVAWNRVGEEHNKFMEAILSADCHVITTLRTKVAFVLEENSQGKMVPRKKGMEAQIRDGAEYEFDVVFTLDQNHNYIASKDRSNLFKGDIPQPLDASVGTRLVEWLNDGDEYVAPAAPEINVKFLGEVLEAAISNAETLQDCSVIANELLEHEKNKTLPLDAIKYLSKKLSKKRGPIENF